MHGKKMPSLQQIKDCQNTDLTGSDILQKHSINSILEHNSDIINRGLASPNEAKSIGSFDIFGANAGTNNQSSYYSVHSNHNGFLSTSPNNQVASSPSSTHSSSTSQQQLTTNNPMMVSNANCNGNHNQMQSSTKASAADFQFENRSFSGSSNNLGQSKTSQMKAMSRNHLTLDCSSASPRNFAASPLFGNSFNNFDTNLTANSMPSPYAYQTKSISPFPDYTNTNMDNGSHDFSVLENHNILHLMNYLNLNQSSSSIPSYQQIPQHSSQQSAQQTTPFGSVGSGGSGCTSPMSPNEFDMARLQSMQKMNTLRLLQQQQQQSQQQAQLSPMHGLNPLTLNHLMNGSYNQYKNWQLPPTPITPTTHNEVGLDRFAKFHRSSAAINDPSCTWSGSLPMKSHRILTYSPKFFLGGIPWDISEQSLVHIFKEFGPIRVEWPSKDQKGFAYIIFESEKQLKALLQACHQARKDHHSSSGSLESNGSSVPSKYYFKISSKRIKAKQVEVIPWVIADSNYVKAPSQKLDPTLTVFVGALHGKLTAEGLATVMNDLFEGVVYAGLDTDKYKYPIGSGRVTFNNTRSYMKAVSAAFIEIKTSKFSKKVQVDPYLEDSLCSACGVTHGPYYCRDLSCFRYFCRTCWAVRHYNDSTLCNHKPLTRNSKSTQIIGVGPQNHVNTPTTPTTPNVVNAFSPQI
ncbi:cytoplasmic polyadenylation element-binding protein 1 [Culicoides brevitarsis]|uniref:cytoplasmic polyadenylation element-binding protein 1 n=1 Tax=Culicoides brevitarsis TaxID=469753 RepID=UPI00307B9FE2